MQGNKAATNSAKSPTRLLATENRCKLVLWVRKTLAPVRHARFGSRLRRLGVGSSQFPAFPGQAWRSGPSSPSLGCVRRQELEDVHTRSGTRNLVAAKTRIFPNPAFRHQYLAKMGVGVAPPKFHPLSGAGARSIA